MATQPEKSESITTDLPSTESNVTPRSITPSQHAETSIDIKNTVVQTTVRPAQSPVKTEIIANGLSPVQSSVTNETKAVPQTEPSKPLLSNSSPHTTPTSQIMPPPGQQHTENAKLFRSQSAIHPQQSVESPNYIVVSAGKAIVVIAVLCFDVDLRSVKIVSASQSAITVSGTISPMTSFPVAGGSNDSLSVFKSTIPLQPTPFCISVPLPFPCNVPKAQMATFAGKLLITLRTSENEPKTRQTEEPTKAKIIAKPTVTAKPEIHTDPQKVSAVLAHAITARNTEDSKPKPTVIPHTQSVECKPKSSDDIKPKPAVAPHTVQTPKPSDDIKSKPAVVPHIVQTSKPEELKPSTVIHTLKPLDDTKPKPAVAHPSPDRPKPPVTYTPVSEDARPKPPLHISPVQESSRPKPPPPLTPQDSIQPRPRPAPPPRVIRAVSTPVAPNASVFASTPGAPTPPPKPVLNAGRGALPAHSTSALINTGRGGTLSPSASSPSLPPRRPITSDL